MKRKIPHNAVKESFDNLPCGVCFFNTSGLPVLCNSVMHRLSFDLTGMDLQHEKELTSALAALPAESNLESGETLLTADGSVWKFTSSTVRDAAGNLYTEYVAANVTDLCEEQKKLRDSNAEQEKLAVYMNSIVENVTAITREEEILSMKMQIHNEIGWCLQLLRQYYLRGCLPGEKDTVLTVLTDSVKKLQGEIGHDDEPDLMEELKYAADALGVKIIVSGDMPDNEHAEAQITAIVRQCVTNTLLHAGGDCVFVKISVSDTKWSVVITNNGAPPEKEISEGGGLTSLRRRIEGAGGKMTLLSVPVFRLFAECPF